MGDNNKHYNICNTHIVSVMFKIQFHSYVTLLIVKSTTVKLNSDLYS